MVQYSSKSDSQVSYRSLDIESRWKEWKGWHISPCWFDDGFYFPSCTPPRAWKLQLLFSEPATILRRTGFLGAENQRCGFVDNQPELFELEKFRCVLPLIPAETIRRNNQNFVKTAHNLVKSLNTNLCTLYWSTEYVTKMRLTCFLILLYCILQ